MLFRRRRARPRAGAWNRRVSQRNFSLAADWRQALTVLQQYRNSTVLESKRKNRKSIIAFLPTPLWKNSTSSLFYFFVNMFIFSSFFQKTNLQAITISITMLNLSRVQLYQFRSKNDQNIPKIDQIEFRFSNLIKRACFQLLLSLL